MKLAGTRTERNLQDAYSAEARRRNMYIYSGDLAKQAGLRDLAHVFYELAAGEEEHARQQIRFLGGLDDLRENLKKALDDELIEHQSLYPEYARTAREEGFPDIADVFEKISVSEGIHAERCRELLEKLDGGGELTGRTVSSSITKMAQVTLPEQANPTGFVHGGELIKMVDNAAGVAAARHSGEDVVLARVEDIVFHKPVQVGNLVLIDARLTFVHHTSIEVRVELDVESLETGERFRALTALLIMVAIDEQGIPTKAPQLLITTEEQQTLFDEGKARYETHKKNLGPRPTENRDPR